MKVTSSPVLLDTSGPRSGKTVSAIDKLAKARAGMLILPLVGRPGSHDLGDQMHERHPRFVGWVGHGKMCNRSDGENCHSLTEGGGPRKEIRKASASALEGFWTEEWKQCLHQETPVCPVEVGEQVALSGKGTILTTMHRLTFPPEPSRDSLEEFVRKAARKRVVVVDEIHRWDAWQIFAKASLRRTELPNPNAKRYYFLSPKRLRPDTEYLETIDHWLRAHVSAASRLYDQRSESLETLQRKRLELLDQQVRPPLFPDGIPLRELDRELSLIAKKRHRWRDDRESDSPRKGDFLRNLEEVLLRSRLGEVLVTASQEESVRGKPTGWAFQFSAADIQSSVEQGRLVRKPRHTILRSLISAAKSVTLLSATPPALGELTYAIQGPVKLRQARKGPGLDILLERSTRGQHYTTFFEPKLPRSAAKNLIAPVVRDGDGVLFLRSKEEHDHFRWKPLGIEGRTAYCRGPESLGKQREGASFVALAGPPHLPTSFEPYCFSDPGDSTPLEKSAAAAGAKARTRLMLQELYQAANRTGSKQLNRRSQAVVFGCSDGAIQDILDPENRPSWARKDHQASFSVLPGRGSTGYDSRRMAIRSWLAGINLRYVQPPRPVRSQTDRHVSPAAVDEWYWVMQRVKSGELPLWFTTKQYQAVRKRHGRGRSKLLQLIEENWVPRFRKGRGSTQPLVKFNGRPARHWFATAPLDLGWDLTAAELARPRRGRRASKG